MDANLCTLAFQRETTWGTTPGSPAMTQLRFTGESLKHEKQTVVSAEIRPDRQVSDIIKVGADAKGDINFELNFTDFQHFLEAAVMGAIQTLAISAVTCSLTHTTQVVAAAAGTFDDVIVGCSVKLAGAATSANNGIKQVVAKASDGSTITLAAGSLTATEASPSMTITGSHLKNGVTPYSYNLERKVPDSAGTYKYQSFAGMQPDTLELNFETKAIVTGKLGFLGKIGSTSSSPLDAALTAPSADTPVNATNNVGTIERGGASMTEKFKKLVLSMSNNLRGRDCVGTEGNFSLGVGTFDLTGSIESYFKDNTLLASVIAHDYTSIGYRVTDAAGNVIVIFIPRLVLSTGNANVSAKDTDVMVPLEIKAARHATYDATILISFIPA